MQNQNPQPELKHCAPLVNRRLIGVSGPDAAEFLQNVMTADIRSVTADKMVYGLLLTPQGQLLHDFFVSPQPARDDAFLLDVYAERAEDLLSRLSAFKLRAKVDFNALDPAVVQIYAHPSEGFADPRRPAMGCRLYTGNVPAGAPRGTLDDYIDFCTRRGIPDTPAMLPQKDFVADLNLDLLGAIAWDKGCYIGQEVTARMHYKGLAKKRLMLVEGRDIAEGDMLFSNGRVVGEVRQSNPRETEQGLAIVRLDSLQSLTSAGNRPVIPYAPEYLEIA